MMRKWRSGAGLIFSLGLILAMTGGSALVASATAGKVDNVTLCHASPPDQFVYQGNEPLTRDPASIVKTNGHDSHSADIIPAFDYETFADDPYDGHYPGKNLDKLSWIANGCAAPPPAKTNVNVSTIVFNAATNAAWAGTEQTGASAYDTSRVVAPSAIPVPTGTVTYSFYTNNACTGDGSSAGTKTLTASGTVPVSDTQSTLAAGSYAFRATYNGDSHYNSKTSDCEPFSVAAAPSKTNVNVSTIVFNATTNAAWAGTEQTGASAYDTSRVVAPSAIPVPTGTVTYSFYTNNACTGDGSSAGTKTLTASGTVPVSDTQSTLAAGSYAFRATYNGDSHYNSKTSDCEPFSVAAAPGKTNVNVSTIVFNAATNAAWAGTEQTGASAYDTSRVVAPSAIPVPTGTVTYTFYTNNACTGDGSSAGTKTLTASGTVPVSDTQSTLAAGSYAFRATYNGDSHYNSKTSDCEPFSVKAATGGVEAATATPTGGVLAATGASTPDQSFGLFLIALGLIAMVGGAFAWRRREA